MKITNKNNNEKRFGDIPVGTTFKYRCVGDKEDRLYLKCLEYRPCEVGVNTVELNECYMTYFCDDIVVNVVKSELIIED